MTRIGVAVAAASVALLLAGCTSTEPPPSYTVDELVDMYEVATDSAWLNSGLAGHTERPVFGDIEDRVTRDNFTDFLMCVNEIGPLSWTEDETGSLSFAAGNGGTLAPELQLSAYVCFAQFPFLQSVNKVLLTEDQREYLYDYYVRWVVPCLRVNGFELYQTPTRERFMESMVLWIPYENLEPGEAPVDVAELSERCGNPLADLDVEHPDWP